MNPNRDVKRIDHELTPDQYAALREQAKRSAWVARSEARSEAIHQFWTALGEWTLSGWVALRQGARDGHARLQQRLVTERPSSLKSRQAEADQLCTLRTGL